MRPSFKQIVFLCLIALFFFLPPTVSYGQDVTVELIWKFPEPGWLEFEVVEGSYNLEYNKSKQKLAVGEKIKVGQSGLTVFLINKNNFVILEEPNIKFLTSNKGIFRVREPNKDWVSYRGNLEITKEGLFWKLFNQLGREDYLKGVVPIEMSNSWAAKGFEALKAQAVAARTYLLKNMDSKGRITDSPDIHQAYWGRTVEGEASKAVEETKGEILVDINTFEPISVFYSAHNGGYSEETQNVWKTHDPHYRSWPDPFSNGIGGYVDRWRFFIAADILGKSFGLAPIRDVKLSTYASGRVYQVVLCDWLGNEKTVSGGQFFQKFYPYNRELNKESFLSRLFQVNYIFPRTEANTNFLLKHFSFAKYLPDKNTTGPLLSRLKNSNEGLADQPHKFGTFVFNGRGWGHGVGMSQWGAYNMAMQGYSYRDILAYYYHNSIIVKR
ncbi:MAG TPA: SpoIID/LytB domain-containing protein [Peptococcaceae bacterium]|nr:SpoIID/LytB domain-containing protein [Peptococcaceae bacterium]